MFAHAVRRASAAWRSGKEDRPAEAGAILAGMLRSRQPPLGTGERELLAELFAPQPANEHDALAGRPPKGAGHPDVVAVMNHLQNEIAKSSLHKNALADTASHFKISVRTVEEYEAITREREAATKAAIRSLYEDD
ncbi:hypothetical protein [Palleronia marisminoris]|nr:hypothetical protein [Palleronia marisminoris]